LFISLKILLIILYTIKKEKRVGQGEKYFFEYPKRSKVEIKTLQLRNCRYFEKR